MESLLLLKHNAFRQETKALFDLLASSPRARESFFNNPAGVMRAMFTFAHPDLESTQGDSAANRLLFSIVSNPKFFEFLERHRNNRDPRLSSLAEKIPAVGSGRNGERAQVLKELTSVFAECGDKEILEGLLTADGAFAGSSDAAPVFNFVVNVFIVTWLVVHVSGANAMPNSASVSFVEMRSLAEALAVQAKLARTSGTPFLASRTSAPAPVRPFKGTGHLSASQRVEAN